MAELLDENKNLGGLLLEEGLINSDQLNAARKQQKVMEKSIGRVLVEMGLITEQAKMTFLHKKFGIEIVDVSEMLVDPVILEKIQRSYSEKHRCAPILIDQNKLVMVMEDPVDIIVMDEIKAQTNMELMPVLAPVGDIEKIISQYPAMSQDEADALKKKLSTPAFWRFFHPAAFWFIIVLPIILIVLMMQFSDQFGNKIAKLGSDFDILLFFGLSLILWAVAVWEVDGIFFSDEEEEDY